MNERVRVWALGATLLLACTDKTAEPPASPSPLAPPTSTDAGPQPVPSPTADASAPRPDATSGPSTTPAPPVTMQPGAPPPGAPAPMPPGTPMPPAGPQPAGAAAAFFRPEVIHKIEITIDPVQWQAFMAEHADVDSNRTPAWRRAAFRIDGKQLNDVGFKTFGYGSREANANKPNLNLDISKYLPAQSLDGIERMRIKNGGQDISGLRQTLTYEALRAVGALAPRSTFAELFVNGEPYGFYFVEESFNKAFVLDRTGNDNGAAYEAGYCHGFVTPAAGGCDALVMSYQRAFNPTVGRGEDLAAVCRAMNGPAETLLTAVAPLIHLDEWIDVLAIDTALVGDHDGYSIAGNNFRLYHDTKLDRLRLVILGPDDTFNVRRLPAPNHVKPEPGGDCDDENPSYRDVFLDHLTSTPTGLARYQQAVRRLRTGPVAAEGLKQRVDALWAIIGARVKGQPARLLNEDPEASKESIKTYIDQRWAALASAGF